VIKIRCVTGSASYIMRAALSQFLFRLFFNTVHPSNFTMREYPR